MTATVVDGPWGRDRVVAAALALGRRIWILVRATGWVVIGLLKAVYVVTAAGVIGAIGYRLLTITVGGLAADLMSGAGAADASHREDVASLSALVIVAGVVAVVAYREIRRDANRPRRALREWFRSLGAAASALVREWSSAGEAQFEPRRPRRGRREQPLRGELPTQRSGRPVPGQRMWLVGPDAGGGGPVLIAPIARSVWSGRHMDADCDVDLQRRLGRGPGPPAHEAPPPVLDCTCGIYALKRPGWPMPRHRTPLARGRIELSGRVIEGSRGFRGRHAEIIGPLDVLVRCAGCLEEGSGTPRPAVGGEPAHPGVCPFGVVTLAVGSSGYVGLCSMHAAQAEHLLSDIVQLSPLGLQAQLELRYGVEVRIKERSPTWT